MALSNRRAGSFNDRLYARKKSAKRRARTFLIEALEERTVLATVSGFVYMDANGNGVFGAGEIGVPGSQITLTGTDSANNPITRTALTGDNGAYSFGDLPAGTYGIFQQQPTALGDGADTSGGTGITTGNNQFTNIVVTADQTVANMNFGERGIFPEYAGIQCFFASATSQTHCFREMMAIAEDRAGNASLAAAIRAGSSTVGNQAPTAVNNTYNATAGVALTVNQANGVLANDTDPDNNALTAALVSNVTNGTLTLNANGSFTYTPNASFTGTDTFTYRANDGSLNSNTATVTITVGANTAPVAVNDTYTTAEDTVLTVPLATGVLANDTDANSNALTAAIVTQPTSGTLTLNTDGTFTYTPNANFSGTDTFTYRANDGSLNSANATVTITVTPVNDAPVAANDSYSTPAGAALNVPLATGVLANDTDVDNATLTAAVVTTTTNGTLTLNTDGSFTYTPNSGFTGTDTFTYRASDGTANSANATVTITVGTNTAPVAVNDTYTTDEDVALTVNNLNGVLANDTDAEANPLTAIIVTQPASGSLTLNSNGSFTYTPNANFNGSDSFTYKANDGTADSGTATVTITVTPVNDAPVAVNNSYATVAGQTLTVTQQNGVLANDTDVESSTLTAIVVATTTNGTLTLASNGSFTYVPNSGFTGTDTFTYKANDGTADSANATVTITVAANEIPVAVADTYAATEDTTLTVTAANGVLFNDTDANSGQTITAVLVTPPATGTLNLAADGSFTYTPALNATGAVTFTYKANDGVADSNTVTVTINIAPVNDAPVGEDKTYAGTEDTVLNVDAATGLLQNATDAEGDSLTAVLVGTPTGGSVTVNNDGSFTFTPTENFSGEASFEYKINDGTTDSANFTVTINVAAVDDPPVAVADTFNATEDTLLTVDAASGVLANDTDVDDATLTAILVDAPATGTLNLAADGSFTYQPAANASGPVTFTYKANDGTSDSNTVTVTINVTTVNDAPVGENKTYDATEDTVLTVEAASGLLENASDEENDPLTAVLVGTPTGGTVEVNEDGSFTFTPTANFNGAASFQYAINDGTADSVTYTVTINVAAINDAPVAVNDSYQTAVDAPLTVNAPGVLGNDTDIDGDLLTPTLVNGSGPLNGTLTFNPDGSFTYTPNSGFQGTDGFSYTVSDGVESSTVAAVTIVVNSAPVAQNDEYAAEAGQALTISAPGVLDNDTDADIDSLIATIVDLPTNGTLTLNNDGSFVYTADAEFTGTDTFTYRANDGLSDSNLATVTITVSPANAAPVAVDDAYTVDEDTTLEIDVAGGVLDNDTDAELQSLTAVVVDQPANGTLTLNANGSFSYTPDTDFSGTDTFTYRANDGSEDSNLATVTITVTAVNDAPVGANKTYEGTEDVVLSVDAVTGVLAGATDVDGGALTAVLVGTPVGGTVQLETDGSFSFTPTADFNGSASFEFKINDGSADSPTYTATIAVASVNDAPVAVDDNVGTDEDTPLIVAAPGVLSNDTDADGDGLTATVVTPPANGTLDLSSDGSYTYTPNENFTGADTFTYQVSDSQAVSNVATVTIQVAALNDAPTAINQGYTAQQDIALVISVPGLLAGSSDPDGGDTLSAIKVSDPSDGTVTVEADGSFTYTPDSGFTGTDSFTYKINDGTADSNTATVTITVEAAQGEPPFETLVDEALAEDEDWLF